MLECSQGSAKRRAPGSVNFAPAVAYHVCLGLPYTHPGARLFAEPCTLSDDEKEGKAVNQCEYFCFCCFTSLHRIHFNETSAVDAWVSCALKDTFAREEILQILSNFRFRATNSRLSPLKTNDARVRMAGSEFLKPWKELLPALSYLFSFIIHSSFHPRSQYHA